MNDSSIKSLEEILNIVETVRANVGCINPSISYAEIEGILDDAIRQIEILLFEERGE
jgi:hypothetical protein